MNRLSGAPDLSGSGLHRLAEIVVTYRLAAYILCLPLDFASVGCGSSSAGTL